MAIKGNQIRSFLFTTWLLFFSLAAMQSANASLQWQNVRSSMSTRGLATNGSIYVTAAANGIFTSSDRAHWTRASLPSNAGQSYNDVIWSAAGSEFVAAGLGTILTSPDGSTWTASYTAASGLNMSLKSVIYANGTYVAVGTDNQGGVVLVSPDGSNWQLTAVPAQSGYTLEFDGIAWGNNLYVTIGVSYQISPLGQLVGGSDVIYTSPDAVNWTAQMLLPGGEFNAFGGNDAAFANNTFVLGGSGGIYTSNDGVNWTSEFLPSSTSNDSWLFGRILAINGGFFAVGLDIGNPNYSGQELAVFTSSDGTNWSMTALNEIIRYPSYTSLAAMIQGGPGYVVAGDAGMATSANGSTWTFNFSSPKPINISCVYYDHTIITAMGFHDAITSGDGIHWTAPSNSAIGFSSGGQGCMAANGTEFVAASISPAYSSDGLTWNYGTNPVFYGSDAVAYQGSKFYALGLNNSSLPQELDSSDGKTWSTVNETGLPSDGIFGTCCTGGLSAGGGNLIAWGTHSNGGQPFMAVSGGGTQWSLVNGLPSALAGISAVGFGNGTYIAVGNDSSGNAMMLSSSNATNWSQVGNLPAGLQGIQWGNITYGGNMWLITGTSSHIPGMAIALTSSDGKIWSLQNLNVGNLFIPNGAWVGSGFLVATNDDLLYAAVSGSSGGGSGGGGSGGGTSSGGSGGGGGTLGFLSLAFLGLIAGFSRRRRMLQGQI